MRAGRRLASSLVISLLVFIGCGSPATPSRAVAPPAQTIDVAPPAAKSPASPESGHAWLVTLLGRVVLGKTTPDELHAYVGPPLEIYAHGMGITMHRYRGGALRATKEPSGYRYFMEIGGVIAGVRLEDDDARRSDVRALLDGWPIKSWKVGVMDYEAVCGVDGRADLGLVIGYAPNGAIGEMTLSAWRSWTVSPNPCDTL